MGAREGRGGIWGAHKGRPYEGAGGRRGRRATVGQNEATMRPK